MTTVLNAKLIVKFIGKGFVLAGGAGIAKVLVPFGVLKRSGFKPKSLCPGLVLSVDYESTEKGWCATIVHNIEGQAPSVPAAETPPRQPDFSKEEVARHGDSVLYEITDKSGEFVQYVVFRQEGDGRLTSRILGAIAFADAQRAIGIEATPVVPPPVVQELVRAKKGTAKRASGKQPPQGEDVRVVHRLADLPKLGVLVPS